MTSAANRIPRTGAGGVEPSGVMTRWRSSHRYMWPQIKQVQNLHTMCCGAQKLAKHLFLFGM